MVNKIRCKVCGKTLYVDIINSYCNCDNKTYINEYGVVGGVDLSKIEVWDDDLNNYRELSL